MRLSASAALDHLTFTELRDALEMTDGNLSVHLQKLEDRSYVTIDKQFVGRRPQTTCRLTKTGRRRFLDYLAVLERLVRDAAKAAGKQPATLSRLGILPT